MKLYFFIVLFTISILSITGLYAYALFDVTSVGEIEDGTDTGVCTAEPSLAEGEKCLDGVLGTAIYTVGSSTYVVAASEVDDGIEIIDISDPTSPTSVGQLEDGSGCATDDIDKTCLAHVSTVAATTIDGGEYVVAAGHTDDGIEIVDVSSPDSPVQTSSFSDTTPNSGGCTTGTVCLDRPNDVAIATIGGNTYAVVAAANDDGIAIIDISTPGSPTHVISIVDDAAKELDQAYSVAIATISGSTYVVAVGYADDGIAIIDISTPASPSSVGRLTDRDDPTRELDGANGVAITTIGSSTYAVVTGTNDDGVSIIDISTPSTPVIVSELEDGTDTGVCTAANGERCLDGPRDVEIETINGLTYAIVVSYLDDALTIIDITDVSNPTIVASMYNSSTKELDEAKGVSIVTIGGSTYVVVGSTTDDGIEIIRIMEN